MARKNRRYRYSLYHQTAVPGNLGRLVPLDHFEVAPGDTISGRVGNLFRFSPIKHALLTDIFVDTYMAYIPHRLVWSDWENFLAEGPSDSPTYSTPTLTATDGATDCEDLFFPYWNESFTYSAIPIRCYNLFFNEYCRDDTLTPLTSDYIGWDGAGQPVSAKKNFHSTVPSAKKLV